MIHKLSESVIGIIVPEGAQSFLIYNNNELSYECNIHYGDKCRTGEIETLQLPSGSWQIINLVSECSEEEARGVMPTVSGWETPLYYDYTAGGRDYRDIVEAAFKDALPSLHSFARSLSVPPNRLLIIKKK